jgi:hypothetical protein
VRQIRMLRARRRELETGLRRLPHGHEGENSGYGQGAAYGLPRQFPTLPPSWADAVLCKHCRTPLPPVATTPTTPPPSDWLTGFLVMLVIVFALVVVGVLIVRFF